MSVLRTIRTAIGERLSLWLAVTFGFVILYYAGMMAALVIRFGKLPNYVTFYDWIGNVSWIIQSTPSVGDMLPIILDEWLVEIGFMNTDYGMGISEWSMTVIPPKVLLSLLAGALMATGVVLLLRKRTCAASTLRSSGVTVGAGTLLVILSNVTMSWVVCCATPSWIVGLAMLGVGVATANALEPFGFWINAGGFLMLAASVLVLARAQTSPAPAGARSGRAAAPSLGESHA